MVYFGQSLVIEGTIDGNVAAMCQAVIIDGTINGKLDVLSQSVIINETGVVTGDIIAEAVQSLVNNGRVDGEISGTYQNVTSDEEVIQSE